MEKQKKKQYILIFSLMAAILIVDQIVKLWVKTHMAIGDDIPLIGDWCRLHFVENEGFAFGMSIGGSTGKVFLTLFRLVASGGILWFLLHEVKKGMRTGFAVAVTLIFIGAVGNLIDSFFYGLIFNESIYQVATLFPDEGGYAPMLQGRVVDMFYFPLIDTHWPDWMPLVGGKPFTFFNAIFNVADSAITVGAFWLIIDQLFFTKSSKTEK